MRFGSVFLELERTTLEHKQILVYIISNKQTLCLEILDPETNNIG